MILRQLLDELKSLPDEMLDCKVILQIDPEGNGYNNLSGVDPDCIMENPDAYHPEIYSAKWSADDACMEPGVWAKFLERPRCIVLFP